MSDPSANQSTDTPTEPPPSEIASMEVLEAEGGKDGPPTVEIRGEEFRLRTAIPSTLLGRFASMAKEAAKHQAKLPTPANGEAIVIDNPTPAQAKAMEALGGLMADSYNALFALFDEQDREDAKDWVDSVDPPFTDSEQADLTREAIAKITGRPTVPS